jgi:ATP-binding cassette, subfamily B, bacterial
VTGNGPRRLARRRIGSATVTTRKLGRQVDAFRADLGTDVGRKARPNEPAPFQTLVDRARAQGSRYAGLRLYRRLLLEARPYWRHIGGLFGLSLLSSVFALLTPLPLKIAVDSVVGSHPLPGFIAVVVPAGARQSQTGVLLVAAGLFVLIALLRQLQQFGNLVLSTYTGEKLLLEFRSRLFRHAERVSLGYHDSRGTADSTYRIQYDATAVQTLAVTGLIPFFTATVTVAGMIYVTARIDWQLALVSLAVVPVLFLTMRVYRKRLRAQWHDAKRLESSALSVVQESLEALRVVKAFGREDDQRDRFADRSATSVRAKISLSFVEGRFGIVVGATIGLGMGTILFLGTRHVLAGTMTLGELVLVMGYLQQFYDPLKTASKKVGSLQSSLASAERVYSLFDQEPDFVDSPDSRPLVRAAGAVTFRNVSFAYEDGRRVLHDVSFEVPPGARLGIAGMTGAGKTTLVSLLTRFYDPSSGEILLDGVDLHRYRLADLRNQFAIVLQEPVLFSTSIAENIAYARPGADDADLVAAAKAASAHDFISALPDGYDTLVGERGVRLSGGERQRIALARAFLKDAPILILDEPTSSVDARTESQILESMERLMSGRTAFMIAHRASTLEICDARLELENGRIVSITLPDAGRSPRARPVAEILEAMERLMSDPPTFTIANRPSALEIYDSRLELEHGRAVGVTLPDSGRAPLAVPPVVVAATTRVGAPTRRRRKHIPVPCDPVHHPVAGAWRTIAPARSRIKRVDRLRARDKDEIYRLTLGNGTTSVVAKRGRSGALLVERTIYESVLPRLPSPALRYFGFVGDEDEEFAWLFIEDAGDDPCSLARHGTLAAHWLGTLHGAAAELDLGRYLPQRGPDHYLEHLRHSCTTIIDNFDNPALGADDKGTLEALVATCELIKSSWGNVEALCSDLPCTLVHGDLVERNLRLRRDDAGPAVVAFDWECSGIGVPAIDVYTLAVEATREDLSSYRKTISEYARSIGEDELRALVLVGNGFRLLASVDWVTPHLCFPWPERATTTLRGYEQPLREWGERLAAAANVER